MQLLIWLLTFVFLIVVGFGLLYLTALIPSKTLLQPNIEKSLETFEQEGQYPLYGLPWRKVVIDNFTESLMYNTAYSVDHTKPGESIVRSLRYGSDPTELNQITNLRAGVNGTASELFGYERYWHGYMVILRPLLIAMPLAGIRMLYALVLYSGLALYVYLLWSRVSKPGAVAVLFGFIMVDVLYIWRLMQFSNVFLIGVYYSIVLILVPKSRSYLTLFTAGAVTACFDLLTAPLVVLGCMLLTLYLLKSKLTVLLASASWSMGYVLFWASKWVIAQLTFVPAAIGVSLNQILNRTVNQADASFSHMRTIQLNFMQLVGYDRRGQVLLLVISIILFVVWIRYVHLSKQKFQRILPLIFIALMPYAWYLVAANHSYLHVWFTYRIQLLTIVSGLLIMIELTDHKKFKNDITRFLPH